MYLKQEREREKRKKQETKTSTKLCTHIVEFKDKRVRKIYKKKSNQIIFPLT